MLLFFFFKHTGSFPIAKHRPQKHQFINSHLCSCLNLDGHAGSPESSPVTPGWALACPEVVLGRGPRSADVMRLNVGEEDEREWLMERDAHTMADYWRRHPKDLRPTPQARGWKTLLLSVYSVSYTQNKKPRPVRGSLCANQCYRWDEALTAQSFLCSRVRGECTRWKYGEPTGKAKGNSDWKCKCRYMNKLQLWFKMSLR